MTQARAPSRPAYAVLAFPVVMLATSFYQRIPGGFYETAFVFSNYARLFSKVFFERTAFSLGVSVLAAAICVAVGFPFTYFLTRMRRRPHVALLILLLSALSLSEVIVGFSWSVLLGRASGISNILVWLGLMDEASAYAPGFWAVMLGLCYIAFPYCVLTLYPPLTRLDPELTEAAHFHAGELSHRGDTGPSGTLDPVGVHLRSGHV